MIRTWMGKTVTTVAFSLAAVGATSTAAVAQTGTIGFQGTANIQPQNPTGGTLVGAPNLLIDFLSGQPQVTPGAPTGTFDVAGRTGIFSGVGIGTAATVSDLLISALTSPISTTTLSPIFLSVGGFNFFATSFPNQTSSGSNVAFGPLLLRQTITGNTVAELNVTGTVSGTANGTFTGTLTSTFVGITPTDLFTSVDRGNSILNKPVASDFSVTINTVPEPSTYALMAAGLAGIAFVARRRRMTA